MTFAEIAARANGNRRQTRHADFRASAAQGVPRPPCREEPSFSGWGREAIGATDRLDSSTGIQTHGVLSEGSVSIEQKHGSPTHVQVRSLPNAGEARGPYTCSQYSFIGLHVFLYGMYPLLQSHSPRVEL